jgi:hypothetical protein
MIRCTDRTLIRSIRLLRNRAGWSSERSSKNLVNARRTSALQENNPLLISFPDNPHFTFPNTDLHILTIERHQLGGEALVSGLVSADNYKVREGRIIEKTISTKKLAIYALKEGGTEERKIEPDQQKRQTLTDEQILQLEHIGRKIEAYFACPQDIEWCLFEDTFYIVQSRPITTLYPIPDGKDGEKRVYISFGHQQMMTDAIKPLGISFLQLLGDLLMHKAGGRLFLDITHDLASPIGRRIVLSLGKSDPLMQNAMKRKDFIQSLPRGKRVLSMRSMGRTTGLSWDLLFEAIKIYWKNDVSIIQNLISETEASIRDLQRRIANVSGDELFAFILPGLSSIEENHL